MNLKLFGIWLIAVESAFYHLSYNYGQVFKDLSGEGNHGVNGNLVVVDAADTYPTDRGAYFSSTTYIKLPPNPKVTTSIPFASPFSFYAWVMPINNRGTIFLRYKDSSNYFFIMRGYWLNTLSIRLCRSDYDSGDIDGNTNGFPYEAWKLIVVTYSGSVISGYVDTVLNIQYTIPSNTFGTGTFEYYIGKESPIYSGFIGFIYYAGTKNEVVNPSNLIGSASSVCFETGCDSCSASIVDPVLNLVACASTRTDKKRNSKGNNCGSNCDDNKVGCDNDRNCLLCECDFKSCVLKSSLSMCICPSIATATQLTCKCPSQYYHLEGECLSCMDSCSTCISGTSCTSCKANYAVLSSEGICSCHSAYYSANQYLNTTDACMPCNSECLTCSQGSFCLTCKSTNASPNPLGGCKCNDGFYGSSLVNSNSCSSCYTGCKTCTEAYKCTTCTDPHASISATSGCTCNDGYYLSSSTCIACHSDCFSCVGANTCATCKDANATPDTIGCKCINGYTINPANSLCSICSTDCTACNSNFYCISCVDANASPNTQFSCDCNQKYYKNLNTCVSCHYSCKTCTGSSTCITCLDLNAEVSTVGCKCKSGFYESGSLTCEECDLKCSVCSDFVTCLACVDGNAEVVSGVCECKQKFFEDDDGACVGCLAECSDCEDNSTCTGCVDNNAEVANGLCHCKTGFFDNGSICEACSNDCETCSDSYSCLSCSFNNSLPDSNGVCLCNDLYYNTTTTCDSCHIDCATCSEALKCTTCQDPNSEPSSTSGCTCKQTFYLSSNLCQSCLSSCQTCSNNETCSSCKDPNAELVSGLCNCKSTYYQSSSTCEHCHADCATCEMALKCLTCIDANSEPDIIEGCVCKLGFYFDTVSCASCGVRCSNCTSASLCVECSDANSGIANGICECDNGFYSGSGNVCQSCHEDCETCLAVNLCESCKDVNAEADASAGCRCKVGFYKEGGSCVACPGDCASCESNSVCLSCKDVNGDLPKLCACKDGMYFDSVRVCQSCDPSCATCDSFTSCTSCSDLNSFLQSGVCYCNQKYYKNSNLCSPCDSTCSSCDNPTTCLACLYPNAILTSSNTCICPTSYVLQSNSCVPCDSSCLTCSSPTTCLKCSDSNAEIQPSDLCACKSNFYLSGTCLPCDSSCNTCSSQNSCLTCLDVNAEVQLSGLCGCKNKFYYSGTCLPCDSSCSACLNGSSCTACFDMNAEIQASGLCACKSKFYLSGSCLPCDPSCLACTSQSICTSCSDINAEIQPSGLCACKTSYYQSDSCLPCDTSCNTCSSQITCTSCSDPKAEIQPSGLCACKSKFYFSGTCLPCNPLCNTCLNSLSCTSCADPNMIIALTGLCECNTGYYFDGTLLACQQCLSGCSNCNNSLTCIECSDPHTYGDTCLNCNEKCLTCNGGTLFDCLSCDGGYLFNGFCIENCPLKFLATNGTCELNSDTAKILEYNFEGSSEEFYDMINHFIASQCIVEKKSNETRMLIDNGVIPVYQRGAYFYGNEMLKVNISTIYLLPSSFSVSIWIKPKTSTGYLINKSSNITDIFTICLSEQKVLVGIQVNNQVYTFESSNKMALEVWTHLLLSVSYTENTSIELLVDTEKNIYEIVSQYPFMDLNSEFLYIGGSSLEELYYEGYFYSLEIYAQTTAVSSLVSECTECNLCPYGGSCIPECEIGEFYDTSINECASCPDECPQNCRYSTTCQLCEDSYCMSCFSYELNSCLSCEPGYQVIDYTCEKCLDSQYYDSITEKCFDCQKLCNSCTSSSICTNCIENSEIVEGICNCLKGFEYLSSCQRVYFSAKLQVTEKNNIILIFTENLKYSLAKNDLDVKIDDKNCDYELAEYTKSKFSLRIDDTNISKESKIKIIFIGEILSEAYSLLKTELLQGDLHYSSQVKEAQQLVKETKAAKAAAKTGSTAGASAVAGLGLLTMDPTSFFDFLNTAEMFYSVYFFNLEIHPILSEYLIGMRVQDLIPNFYGYLISPDLGVKMPKKFKKFGYDSNLILLNVGVQFTTLTVALFIIMMVSPLYCIKKVRPKLGKVTKIFKFGFFLRFWLQTSFETMIACTFGIIYSDFSGGAQKFDLILSFFILFLQGCFLVLFLYLVKKRSELRDEREIKKFIKLFGTFFEEFKKDGVHNWLFYVIYVFRRIILVILYHSMSFGVLQLAICMAMSLSVINI